mmetsp:Transcript_36588/g.44676  ORF Transcript_36588/g.44676 Transcript_36588/m.44676 type:complete len:91 (+) Transcript_36588:2106-2378(+)
MIEMVHAHEQHSGALEADDASHAPFVSSIGASSDRQAGNATAKALVGEVICEEDMECDDEPVSSVSASLPMDTTKFATLLQSKPATMRQG